MEADIDMGIFPYFAWDSHTYEWTQMSVHLAEIMALGVFPGRLADEETQEKE